MPAEVTITGGDDVTAIDDAPSAVAWELVWVISVVVEFNVETYMYEVVSVELLRDGGVDGEVCKRDEDGVMEGGGVRNGSSVEWADDGLLVGVSRILSSSDEVVRAGEWVGLGVVGS